MFRPKIGLDWDDVVAPFNSLAIKLANRDYRIDPPLVLEDIDSWENTGRANVIHEYYNGTELYELQAQSIPQTNIDAVRKLEEIADVYFITAVYSSFMTQRAELIKKIFPELGPERMIFGSAKFLVHFDVILDDNICNVLDSKAEYPVLMRKPWNKNMTGLLSVNNLDEFVSLVKHILNKDEYKKDDRTPKVIALVGPSGSKKRDIAHFMSDISENFKMVQSYSTKMDYGYRYLSPEEFKNREFFEHTFYGGYEYGTTFEDVSSVLKSGKNAIMVLDMCGAIGMKRYLPTVIVYIKRNKVDIINSIVSDVEMSNDEKTLRLLSIEAEKKNEGIADVVITSKTEEFGYDCAGQIVNLIEGEDKS